ncbi:hypothetical protein B0H14DRAFT_3763952 [Mycena olivaceomarginata]|nr:hypothetical protein B0H14DRAFT_3763952 [Mycena olivaceomarginata]
MSSAIVEYRPGLGCNKHLPKRGTLFPSRPEALAFNWLQWELVNLLLLLLPLGAGVETIVLLGHRLDIFLAYFLVYFSLYTAALLLLFAGMTFPNFFQYGHMVAPFILGRRHRSHFSFMSDRRKRALCGPPQFMVFVLGSSHRSIPMTVTGCTTFSEIYAQLEDLELVPPGRRTAFYLDHGGRRVLWSETLASRGTGPLSYLHLRLLVFGGANEHQAEASSSRSRPARNRDNRRFEALVQAEGLDEFGNPETPKRQQKRKRPAPKAKENGKEVENSDPKDADFSGPSSDESSDSDIEEVLSNAEFAESLPTKTIPEASRRRKATTKADKPPKKKSKGKSKVAAPSVIADEDDPMPPPSPPQQKKRNAIYHFFEQVDEHRDGSVEEGARYYKCYLGSRRVFKITRKMNYNTNVRPPMLRWHWLMVKHP